ncbi:MAG TPA: hypothetical protein GX500_05450 [Firmicutes bacterium]|nr:hypothetical protein [Candidatus Fermentithermobacillaceae bacterium]
MQRLHAGATYCLVRMNFRKYLLALLEHADSLYRFELEYGMGFLKQDQLERLRDVEEFLDHVLRLVGEQD